jgi:radical SAM protein with 4Fe4S-binding SPASM domain
MAVNNRLLQEVLTLGLHHDLKRKIMVPSDIGQIKEDKFWAHFYKRTAEKGVPFKASFELTLHCNLSCCHCYVTPNSSKEELSYEEICSILDQLAEIGCFHLNLTGGEIFTRSDIFKILEYAKKKGFYLILLTNGTLITPEVTDCLKDLNINQVDISLYGMTEKTYESITQVSGSFQRCLQGINLLHDRKIPICIKMTVMNLNVGEFNDVKGFAKKLKVPFRWGYFIHPKIDGSKAPLEFRISPEEGVELERRNRPYLLEEEKNSRESFSKRDGLFYCNAGRNSLAITPYGELNLCLEYHFPRYDLRKGSVPSGWRELVNYAKSAKPGKNYQCKNCELEEFCQWCPAEGWLNKGNRNACVPYFKELARIRKEWIKGD